MEDNSIAESSVMQDMQKALESDDLPSAVGRIKPCLEQLDRAELNIAVTGESGSGKSTFINAFRHIGHEEENSAKTDVVQTTDRPTAYVHPEYQNVKLWDLPGIDTPDFKADEYLKLVEFERYDFFIIIGAGRFRQCHAQLSKEIDKMKKKFYFVRSQIDFNISSEQNTKKEFDKEKTLNDIRADCIRGLKEAGLNDPSVFLISNLHIDQYDFNRLEETMKRELPQQKKHVLKLAISNISETVNDRKKKAFRRNIWKLATRSGVVLSLQSSSLKKSSISVDVEILVKEIQEYYKAFELDIESLEKLTRVTGKSVDELKSKLKFPLNEDINNDVVINLLMSSSDSAFKEATDYWQGLVPDDESLPSGLLSFANVYYMLKKCLNELAEDAKNVLSIALETPV